MKLKNIANKAKQETVSFFKDPKKVQGLAVGIVGMVCTGLLVNEVNTSKHKKELKDSRKLYYDKGFGGGYATSNLDTLGTLNYDDKLSKEEAIIHSNDFDVYVHETLAGNERVLKEYDTVKNRYHDEFEDMLN